MIVEAVTLGRAQIEFPANVMILKIIQRGGAHLVCRFARYVAGFITGLRLFFEKTIQFRAGLADQGSGELPGSALPLSR
jgi:hypothetical protein